MHASLSLKAYYGGQDSGYSDHKYLGFSICDEKWVSSEDKCDIQHDLYL